MGPPAGGGQVTLVLATELPGAEGGLGTAAAVAVALAGERDQSAGTLMVEVGGERDRGPTMLAARGARELEERLRAAGLAAAARGRLCWLRLPAEPDAPSRLAEARALLAGQIVVAYLPPPLWRQALDDPVLDVDCVHVRADLPSQRALAALLVAELHGAGTRVRIATRPPGRIAARRAVAGIDPGGATGRRTLRLARGLRVGRPSPPRMPTMAAERGQALPLALGAAFVLIFATLALAALGGAVTGKSRVQRAADLAALSAARSMRDDFERLFVPPELLNGSPNPAHLSKAGYLGRASAAAAEAARRNEVDPGRLRISFPDGESFAPLRVRAELRAAHDLPGRLPELPVVVEAEATAAPVEATDVAPVPPGAPAVARGGGYAGPLAYRQGEPMRPDVAAAFDRLAAAARADGLAVIVNSGFRSDAEQATLWAQNPDPRWVAPPGTSLHRCATELDLGPPTAYGWLAANAQRFGFLKRYAWEPWHFGYVSGPAPCSADGDRLAGAGAEAAEPRLALPSFVPAAFREPLAGAASRWNVPAALLAAQLMAESNFNPFSVSPAGAQGIAQFMPATAAAYGLRDPFDAEAAIDAQAHLMADLLQQFDGQIPLALAAYNAGPAPVAACGCVPPYAETQAYVARILGLMDGAGAIPAAPELEVRLVG